MGNTLEYIVQKYGLDINVKNLPIIIPGMSRGTLAQLFAELDFQKGVEIGVQGGKFTAQLGHLIPNATIYGIDPWLEYPDVGIPGNQEDQDAGYEIAKARVPSNCILIRKINKSDHDAFLRFYETTLQDGYIKYLTIPKAGYTETEKVFTIPMGVYNVEASYCDQDFVTMYKDLTLFKSEFTIPIPPCNQKPVSDAVADGVLKLSPWLYPPVDIFDKPIIYDLGYDFNWQY